MKKTKLLSLLLASILVLSACCAFFVGVNANAVNLLEEYNCNPHFEEGVAPWGTLDGEISQIDTTSADGDGYSVLLTNRTKNYANAHLTGEELLKIFTKLGGGTYYYSFHVKCADKNASCMLSPALELYYQAEQDTTKTGKWLTDTNRTGFSVTGTKWTKIQIEFEVDIKYKQKPLVEAKIYSIQRDFENNAIDLIFDNFTLVKTKDSGSSNSFSDLTPNERTGIGAIYYNMWFKTLDNWWEYDNNYARQEDRNSTQEARSLSPKAYHARMPYFATLNTQITSSKYVKGDLSAGVVEFPEFTQEIWQQEMEFAIEAGIDFMAYLWAEKNREYNASAYNYHIKTKGLNGRIQMCAILQHEYQDIASMAKAMCEPYWYTIDNMPVVYIYGGSSAATDSMISKIRRLLKQAQKAKFGTEGEPAYIIVMGTNGYNESVKNAARGIDATSWYSFNSAVFNEHERTALGVSLEFANYRSLANTALETMKSMTDVAEDGHMGISPLITLGWNPTPRVDNPTTWGTGSTRVVARPAATEITQSVLEVLNWNKKNKDVFKSNTVIIYAWNEFTEGGWICPTAAVDLDGNLLKNEDGTNKINRTHLDAVKAAIQTYRKANGEPFNVTVDVGEQVNIPTLKPTIKPVETPRPTAAPTMPTQEQEASLFDKIVNSITTNKVLLPVGAVAIVAITAVVVIVLNKKKAAANTDAE